MSRQSGPEALPLRFPVKKISYFSDALALGCVDFPIFYIESISERHILLAGGGGSSNTGVHNQINIFELVPTKESCAAELVMKYRTPNEFPDAIMNGSLLSDASLSDIRFATGVGQLIIYRINFNLPEKKFNICHSPGVIRFHQKCPKIKEIKSIKQAMGGRLLTGSTTGQLTVWDVRDNVDQTICEKSIDAHKKMIDEIDENPLTEQVVTLARDENQVYLWKLTGTVSSKISVTDVVNSRADNQATNQSATHNFRSCRFAFDRTTSGMSESCLLIACNPKTSKGSSVLHKLSTRDDAVKKLISRPVTTDGIMAMNVSKDGKYIAIGTRSGGVGILDVRSLADIYKLDHAHQNAVTDLEFLPPKKESLALVNSEICPLLSVSLDRQLILHRPKRGSFLLKTAELLLLALIIFFAFIILHRHSPQWLTSAQNKTIESKTS